VSGIPPRLAIFLFEKSQGSTSHEVVEAEPTPESLRLEQVAVCIGTRNMSGIASYLNRDLIAPQVDGLTGSPWQGGHPASKAPSRPHGLESAGELSQREKFWVASSQKSGFASITVPKLGQA